MRLVYLLASWVAAVCATTASHQVVQLDGHELQEQPLLGEAARTKLSSSTRESSKRSVPAAPESLNPVDAYEPSLHRGIDGGRMGRNTGFLRSLMTKREKLLSVMKALKSINDDGQAPYVKLYQDTQAALRHLETDIGMAPRLVQQAKTRSKVAAEASRDHPQYVADYEKAQGDLKSALRAGNDNVATGEFATYVKNAGHSEEQKKEYEDERTQINAESVQRQWKNKQILESPENKQRYLYETEGAARPGHAYSDGTDHKASDLPGMPKQLKANYLKPHSMTLTWAVPVLNRALLTGYGIYGRAGNSAEFALLGTATGGVSQLMQDLEHLRAGVRYQIKVQALYVPLRIRQMSIQDLQSQLQLHNKDSYNAYRQMDKPQMMIELAQAVGPAKGPFSDVLAVTTPTAKPDAPRDLKASEMAYRSTGADQECQLTWAAPNAHGAAITGYRIQIKKGGGTRWDWEEYIHNTASTDTRHTITGLESGGVQYLFKVAAFNSQGLSSDSDVSVGIVSKQVRTPAAPEKPSYANMMCTAKDLCTMRLDWTEPSGRGGKIQNYNIYHRTNGNGEFEKMLSTDLETHTILKKLVPGVQHEFKVQAVSQEGNGDFSTPLVTGTPAEVPAAPLKPVFGDITGTTAKLTWDAPAANGSPITGYRITFQVGGSGGFFEKVADTNSPDTSFVVTGLQQGGYSYEFKVQAINNVGSGAPSPSSDPCITAYEEHLADQQANAKAHQTFRVNNKLFELKSLKGELSLTEGRLKDLQSRYRLSKERGMKAEDKVQELLKLVNTNQRIAAKTLADSRSINQKKAAVREETTARLEKIAARASSTKLKNEREASSLRVKNERASFTKIVKEKNNEIEDLRGMILDLRNKLTLSTSRLNKLRSRMRGPAQVPKERMLMAGTPRFIINDDSS